MIGEFAYALSARDEQNVPLRGSFINHVHVQASTPLRIQTRPVNDREVWIISAIWIQAQAGAGQNVTSFQLSIETADDPQFLKAIIASETQLAVALLERSYQGFGGALLVDGRYSRLVLRASFNAAVNANQIQLGASGIIIPAGNLGDARPAVTSGSP
jgi:hypothetical protein